MDDPLSRFGLRALCEPPENPLSGALRIAYPGSSQDPPVESRASMAVWHALRTRRLMDGRVPRAAAVAPAVMVLSLMVAWAVVAHLGLPLRDPEGVTQTRLAVCVALIAVMATADWIARPSRWSWQRIAGIAAAVVAFHGTYLAYRNVKSVAPLLRP